MVDCVSLRTVLLSREIASVACMGERIKATMKTDDAECRTNRVEGHTGGLHGGGSDAVLGGRGTRGQ